jgi:hypothetical protein
MAPQSLTPGGRDGGVLISILCSLFLLIYFTDMLHTLGEKNAVLYNSLSWDKYLINVGVSD